MAIISSYTWIAALVLFVNIHSCQSAVSCKKLTQWDTRHPNPKGTVTKCILHTTEDFNSLPLDADGLWLDFPKGNNVTLAPGVVPDMPQLLYLKVDISFLKAIPPGLFESIYLPKLQTLMLLRDLSAVDTKNIAITLKNNIFLGLGKLQNLYLDNLGIQTLEEQSLNGLHSLQTLDLTSNYVNGIKSNLFENFKNLTSLKLSDNFISELEINSFSGLTKLASLDLSLNKLKKLTAGPFQHLRQLELFVATSNNLKTIEPNAFSGVGKLHYLSLARNNLENLDPMVFKGLNSLETLILDHNKVKLASGQFAHVSDVLHLYLAHNNIKEIKSEHFEGLLSLTELILSSNDIATLPSEAFYSLPTLITLDISANKISDVEPMAFRGLTNLETLNIQENKIETMPPGSFEDLTRIKTLYMDQNPWQCSCQAEWLILWLRKKFNQIEPNVQFYYIVCSEDDPIPTETFFALIMSEHFINDLECHTLSEIGDTTDLSTVPKTDQTQGKTKASIAASSSTTEKTIMYSNHMNNTQKIVIIVCSVIAAVILLLILAVHIYCRKRKQRSWDPSEKKKTNGNDMTGHKKVPSSSSADPESGYLGITLNKYTLNLDDEQLVRPAFSTDSHNKTNIYYVYQNQALSTSLEYIAKYTDINHPKRGDLSDDEESLQTYKKQTIVTLEPLPHHKNSNKNRDKRPKRVTINDPNSSQNNSNSNKSSHTKSSQPSTQPSNSKKFQKTNSNNDRIQNKRNYNEGKHSQAAKGILKHQINGKQNSDESPHQEFEGNSKFAKNSKVNGATDNKKYDNSGDFSFNVKNGQLIPDNSLTV